MSTYNLNYEIGVFEAVSLQELQPFTLDEKSPIKLDDLWSFAMADITVFSDSAGTSEVPSSSYVLDIDEDYTTRESGDGGSAKTVYKSITITDNTYAGVSLWISGNSFGSYTDNEVVEDLYNELASNGVQDPITTIKQASNTGDSTLLAGGFIEFESGNHRPKV